MATVSPVPGSPSPVGSTRAAVPAMAHEGSYIDWPAIIAGAVLASAVWFVLSAFGSGVGLSMTSVEPGDGVSLRWLTIAAGIWFIWTTVSSFSAGGYLAGRMRRRIGDASEEESDARDGAHGVVVWATGALLAVFMTMAGIGGLLGATASATGTAAGSAAEMLEENGDYFTNRMLRRAEAAPISPEARAEVATILARGVAEGEVAPDDRAYLTQIVAAETGAEPQQAEAQVNAVLAEIEQAREAALDVAERARIAGIIAAFVLAATMLVSAGAAYFAAVLGGQHRDQNVGFRRFVVTRRG